MEKALSVHINLAGLPARAQRSLQRATNLVAIGLNSSAESPGVDAAIGGITFQYAADEPWDGARAKQEWVRWVLLNGFRDAAESVSEVVEEARTVVAFWRLQLLQTPDRGVSGADWQELMVKEGRRFHRLGLPDKIEFLTKKYELTLEADLLQRLLSINKARNCLVHRGGVVSETERNSDAGFDLSWLALVALFQGPDGEREVVPPVESREGESLAIATRPRQKLFAMGDMITVSSDEFAQICWTMFLFSSELAKSLERLGKARGLTFTESAPA